MTSISVIYVLLAALLLWFVIGAKGRWYLKLVAIILTLAFSYITYSALDSFSGWPAHLSLPHRALFVGAEVIEPDQAVHETGRIYLWLIPPQPHVGLFGYQPKGGEPRAYGLPYSRSLHKAIVKAEQALAHGATVELQSQGKPQGKGKGKHGKANAGNNAPGQYKVYILPPSLPPKS